MTKRVARLKSRKEGYKSKAYWRYLESRSILLSYELSNYFTLGYVGRSSICPLDQGYWSDQKLRSKIKYTWPDGEITAENPWPSKVEYVDTKPPGPSDLRVPPARPYNHRLRVYALDAQERRLVAIANRLVRPVALRLRDPTNRYYLTSDIYWFDEVIDLSNEPDPE